MVIIVKRYFNLYLDLALQMLDIQLTRHQLKWRLELIFYLHFFPMLQLYCGNKHDNYETY